MGLRMRPERNGGRSSTHLHCNARSAVQVSLRSAQNEPAVESKDIVYQSGIRFRLRTIAQTERRGVGAVFALLLPRWFGFARHRH